jgi:hypothetical protein
MDNIINDNDMTKEQLEGNLAALKLLESETNDKLTDHKSQIALLEKQLVDINKPAITPAMMEQIEGAIETAVEDFDFSDDDNFSKEFEIDYDNKVRLSNMEFDNSHDLVAEIAEKVLDLFQEAECPEDETTTDNS